MKKNLMFVASLIASFILCSCGASVYKQVIGSKAKVQGGQLIQESGK